MPLLKLMIRLTIQRKVFIATFALATTMVVLLALVVRWNLGQGFERYTSAAEFARLDWLIRNIESAYATHGNWDFVRAEPERVWRQLSRPGPDSEPNLPQDGRRPVRERGFPPPPPGDWEGRPPPRPLWDDRPARPREDAPAEAQDDAPPPAAPGALAGRPAPQGDVLRIGPRLALLDADGKRLAGNANGKGIGAQRPIQHQGAVVGHLTLQAVPSSAQDLDAAFLASQTRNVAIAGLAALLLSLLAAWALARHLLAPIRELTDGARRIADGRFDSRIAVVRDDELGALAQNFNAMARRLAKVEESRRKWISDASHELRTPLAVLRAEIEAMQDGVRTPDMNTLARLNKQVQQMAALVDDLRLTLEREPGGGDMERTLFSPVEALNEVVVNFRDRFAAAQLTLDITGLADAGWRVRGDAGRMTQVFANLLENTLRYTDAGGRLRITARAAGHRLMLQFDDTAPAPPRSALPHLFERFFRAEPSRSRTLGGSGLGLAICKTIVEAHGGAIMASLSELGGLAVTIELPLEKT
jgi:two-component system, OmpR family, sensor histidine kinase BaeS